MTTSTMRAGARTATAALAALALLLAATWAATAQGAATVQDFAFEEPFTDAVDDTGTCLGAGATGTITGTASATGQTTDTYDFDDDPGSPPGFHAHLVERTEYVIRYDDGRSLVGGFVARSSFNDNVVGTRTESTEAVRDSATLYGADGASLGTVTVHGVTHITFSDANGDFQLDPDEISTAFDRVRFVCPG